MLNNAKVIMNFEISHILLFSTVLWVITFCTARRNILKIISNLIEKWDLGLIDLEV